MADKPANVQLDPYTAKAEAHDLSPQQKIDGLRDIVKQCGHGMLVTRSKEDVRTHSITTHHSLSQLILLPDSPFQHLHARAMHPAACKSPSPRTHHSPQCSTDDNLHFLFIGNNASYKFDEIKANERMRHCSPCRSPSLSHRTGVNVSFIDVNSTNWASISGVAKVHNDKNLIEKLWSPLCVTPLDNFSVAFPSRLSWPLTASPDTSPTLEMASTKATRATRVSQSLKSFQMRSLSPPSLSTRFLTVIHFPDSLLGRHIWCCR